jgi:hypothetical protein
MTISNRISFYKYTFKDGNKYMETTLNIRSDISKKITIGAQARGISRSEMIIILIKKVMDDISNPGRMGKMIQYQDRRSQDEWHTFHLKMREDDYEYFLDLRKLLKMSVSLILAYAVEKFLDKLLKRNSTDNNRYRNYIIARDVIDNIICWKFIWGFPPNIEKFIYFQRN